MYALRAAPPRTLTDAERTTLLDAADSRANMRDHMLFAVALGTGLRLHELVALEIDDVLNRKGGGRPHIELRIFKRCTDDPAPQRVEVPEGLRWKLTQLGIWKRKRGESLEREAPLFVGRGSNGRRSGSRLTRSGAHKVWLRWRAKADLPSTLTFHALRHTYAQTIYDRTGDIEVVRAAVRHADISSTQIYARASAERVARAVRELPC